jgi:hypothetical protein
VAQAGLTLQQRLGHERPLERRLSFGDRELGLVVENRFVKVVVAAPHLGE